MGLPPHSHRIIDRGATELVEHFLKKKRLFVLEAVKLKNETPIEPETPDSARDNVESENVIKENDLIYIAIEKHLDFIAPYLSSWPSALGHLADPKNVFTTLPIFFQTIDDLCYITEVKTANMDWYTERVQLAMLYTITELFMLTDSSENLFETK